MFITDETDYLVNEGSQIKIGGAPGAFEEEFRQMEEKLNEVRQILAGANVTGKDLDELRDKLNLIRYNRPALKYVHAMYILFYGYLDISTEYELKWFRLHSF